MEVITIGANDDPDLCRTAIIEAVNRVDSGDGVAILTDMFGGTPSNLAISCMSRPNVDVLAGINLPMLVKLAKVRQDHSLLEAIDVAHVAGRKYVAIASSVSQNSAEENDTAGESEAASARRTEGPRLPAPVVNQKRAYW